MLEYTWSPVYFRNTVNLFKSVTLLTLPALNVVSTHAHIWFTMYYSCICQARVHTNETRKMCGKNTHTCANQNAQVQFVQTKDARELFVQTMMHMAADEHLMCTRMHLTCIFTSLIFHAHAGYFACIFRNVSSCVVASRVCSLV